MAKEMAWPAKGNKVFTALGGGKKFDLSATLWRYPQHAEAFLTAAEIVIDSYDDQRLVADDLFFPVAYLYRHCLELKLKDMVRVGVELDVLKQANVEKIQGEHNLPKLWTQARKVLEDGWPGADPSPLQGIETVVNDFHQADSDGQAFRYPTDKSGRRHRHEKLPKAISVTALRKTMEGVYSLLDACESFFRDYLSDVRSQMERD
jgi:hypothetical protein